MGKILLCDDEDSLCRSLGRILRAAGHEVVAMDGARGYARLKEERFDLILTDIRMPEVNGFEILAAARMYAPGTPVIAMSGSAEIPDAVRAMHAGARDFLIKPFEVRTLEEAVAAVLKPTPPNEPETDALAWRDEFAPSMLGSDAALLPALSMLAKVADAGCTVLITGESGTGKELAARSLHAGSARAKKPFVAVNCAAIPANLVESELFGHARGSFTGATNARVGRFAQADGGTILLDEIGEMEPGVQAKLLRLIQDGELYPVGEETPTQIDVRVLAATNRDLEREVAAGRFRADLFWRLNVIPVELPPLRDRASDIVPLAQHFMARANERNKRAVAGFDPPALTLLESYRWPGNIRELENVIERAVIFSEGREIGVEDLPFTVEGVTDDAGEDLKEALQQFERQHILYSLRRHNYDKTETAQQLGIGVSSLYRKMDELNIPKNLGESSAPPA